MVDWVRNVTDMTNTKFICINDHHDVEDVGLCQVMAASLDNRMHPNQENIKVQPESTVGVVPKYEILVDATVLAKEERKSQACTFDQGVQEFGCFFWLSHKKHGPAIDAQEIFFIETNQRILTCYYFSQSRPPEQQKYVNRFKWWQLLSLRDIGWGPPNKLC